MRKEKSTPGTGEAKKVGAHENVPSHLQSICLKGEEEDKQGDGEGCDAEREFSIKMLGPVAMKPEFNPAWEHPLLAWAVTPFACRAGGSSAV